ncbi:MAG TPA: universal stress protein [Nocardioides sp.]|uniref:universal stress protein n=1 Tax=Nocardioides sp. TaxID=35761 RepID=UPI002D7FB497|nr:universal stress protein [Nocardioides sp.]HET6654302.1 universal stress protein [Nocardioides sp.]
MSVVVGYIPNEYGEAALTEALTEAQRRGTGLVVVNTSRGDSLVDKKYVGEQGRRELEERLSAAPVEVELRQSIGTDVAQEILEVVREVAAEALVIGIRHRSQVGKMLMGSVATQLLMEAPCPVVAVKP